MARNRVYGTTTDGYVITGDSIAWESTDMDENVYYQRYEDNATDVLYLRKIDQTGGILKIYEGKDTWANRTTATYTALKP